jgi:transposase
VHIRYLGEQIEEVETELKELIEESPTWQVQEDLLCSTPRVAETTARTLLVRIPELGEANLQEIAKLVGLVSIVHESSTWKGEHHIEGDGPTCVAPSKWQRFGPCSTMRADQCLLRAAY